MYAVTVPDAGAWTVWRDAARRAISHHIRPQDIDWTGGTGLFAGDPLPGRMGPHQARVRADFLKLAGSVIWHRDPERFALLYSALWRLDAGDNAIHAADPLGARLAQMAKAVRRDIHKMHAFVRFRELPGDGNRRRFGAWFEPDHHTLEPGAPFFARRFGDMDWLIVTPSQSARFENGALSFGAGGARPDLPDDAAEGLWHTYYANIFNPARVKLGAMRAEMPRKYWKNLPETRLIPDMLADAEQRVDRMHAAGASTPRPGAAKISTRYRGKMTPPGSGP
ncbi:TIGR03915 family putative DNA repair protein [Paracoccus sp. (in: a-proteobacteria)]|uniref:TIGR03915 family putative DNA repair protein n=1 Tax=Paracoccus sp. TaxID=267 RepID=UPI0026DF66AB|nr:TIGR03915 family putative DNA repair protein [Paracoccus sp. (in: a-proteobacteria)]MDO5647043.1 TIGR03915 family putative DNA repair protein [Paracoccus sp. (in: a-proteobacteria)]